MNNKYVRPQFTGLNPNAVVNEAFKEIDALKTWIECQEKRITWIEQRDIGPGGSISGFFTTPVELRYTGNNDDIEIRDQNYPVLLEKVSKLEAENKKLREALEFYASSANWIKYSMSADRETIDCDDRKLIEGRFHLDGKRARAILKEISDGE